MSEKWIFHYLIFSIGLQDSGTRVPTTCSRFSLVRFGGSQFNWAACGFGSSKHTVRRIPQRDASRNPITDRRTHSVLSSEPISVTSQRDETHPASRRLDWSISNSPCCLTRNISSDSTKNLALHKWKTFNSQEWFTFLLQAPQKYYVKPLPNGCNMLVQHCCMQHVACVWPPCCTMLPFFGQPCSSCCNMIQQCCMQHVAPFDQVSQTTRGVGHEIVVLFVGCLQSEDLSPKKPKTLKSSIVAQKNAVFDSATQTVNQFRGRGAWFCRVLGL